MSEPKIKVSYGPNELTITSNTADSIAELRDQVASLWNIPKDAEVKIDGQPVKLADEPKTPIPETAKEVSFTKKSGTKA